MESTEIHAVEMTRRIRERNAERLRDATPEERIQFYRERSHRLCDEVRAAQEASPGTGAGGSKIP